MCKAYLIAFLSFYTLRVVGEMKNVIALNSHPKISSSVDHDILPSMSFLNAAESPPL